MTQAQDPSQTLALPRSFPAWLGVWIAIIGILPMDALVSLWLPATTASGSSMLFELLEFPLLVIGGALTGHLAQFLSEGNRLRLWRILAAALVFDLCFVFVMHLLAGCMSV